MPLLSRIIFARQSGIYKLQDRKARLQSGKCPLPVYCRAETRKDIGASAVLRAGASETWHFAARKMRFTMKRMNGKERAAFPYSISEGS